MDAWEQKSEITHRYTREFQIRDDIRVYARGCDRGVEVHLGSFKLSTALNPHSSTGTRNISTMRELAKAINKACDFVEESNPEWASKALSIRSEVSEEE